MQQILQTVLFLFAETKSIVNMQRPFCAHFGMQWIPSPKTICRLYRQFEQDGTVLKKNCRHAALCLTDRALKL